MHGVSLGLTALFWNVWWIHISADKCGLLHNSARQYVATLRHTVHFSGTRRKLILLVFLQIQNSHFQSHMYSCAFTLSFPVELLFGPTFLFFIWHCFLFFYLYSVVMYTPCVWARYTYSEAQPDLGLGAIFPHPSDTVADSVCPTGKVMLLSRSECHSSVAATLLELSHPGMLTHWPRLVWAISGKTTRLLCTTELPSIFFHTLSSLRF